MSTTELPGTTPPRDAAAVDAYLADPTRLLAEVEETLLDRRETVTPAQAYALAEVDVDADLAGAGGDGTVLDALLALAHRVRVAWTSEEVALESIVSGKTGGCPEDCSFCSQSAVFDSPVKPQPLLTVDEVITAATDAQRQGASEFCIVYAVRGPDERLMANILELTAAVHEHTEMSVAVSAGILTPEQAQALRDAGVVKYNHNLEAARSYFPNIVGTHSWDERWETLDLVRSHGMEVCSGGIVGMGETPTQRAELALELAAFRPTETPLNFLNPRPGTPLAQREPMTPRQALHAIALFRLVLPWTLLRLAGGREIALRDLQGAGILGGVNGLIIGNYLTTLGRSPQDDVRMLKDLDVPVRALQDVL
ncbi:MAG: biotin synthase BioB [Actinobacteria bacterium]|nr:biotin synthase BioB [Actinomycetota bacterium]